MAEMLRDENEGIRHWAIDALSRVNAKGQAKALWQFLKTNTDKKLEGFAIAVLVQFEQKEAVALAIDQLKAMAQGSENYHIWEFINKLKPKFLIPSLISLYYAKPAFLANAEHEKKFRWNVYQQLVNYKTPLAIPIYREHLVDKHMGEESTAWRLRALPQTSCLNWARPRRWTISLRCLSMRINPAPTRTRERAHGTLDHPCKIRSSEDMENARRLRGENGLLGPRPDNRGAE